MARTTTAKRRRSKPKKRVSKKAAKKAPEKATKTLSGTTEEVVKRLIQEGDESGVLSVVRRLELEIKKLMLDVAKAKEGPGRHSEGVTSAQLALLFDELKSARQKAEEPDVLAQEQDDALAQAGALDEELKKRAAKPKPPPQQAKRRDLPASLPRVDNLLPVEAEPDCPKCHAPMVELEPEVTEVVDYEPGRVFVRRDIRQVRACRANDSCGTSDVVRPRCCSGRSNEAALIQRFHSCCLSHDRIVAHASSSGIRGPQNMGAILAWARSMASRLSGSSSRSAGSSGLGSARMSFLATMSWASSGTVISITGSSSADRMIWAASS